MPSFKWPKIRMPSIPGFAEGGVAMSPMLATVAEQKPEAILSLDKLGSMMSGVGSTGGDINIYGDVLDGEDFYDKVNEARLLWERRGS